MANEDSQNETEKMRTGKEQHKIIKLKPVGEKLIEEEPQYFNLVDDEPYELASRKVFERTFEICIEMKDYAAIDLLDDTNDHNTVYVALNSGEVIEYRIPLNHEDYQGCTWSISDEEGFVKVTCKMIVSDKSIVENDPVEVARRFKEYMSSKKEKKIGILKW